MRLRPFDRPLHVGVAPNVVSGPDEVSGNSRVWREVGRRLGDLGALDDRRAPDVWFYSGHGGDPGLEGPAVAVVFEAGWEVPGVYDDYPPDLIASIAGATGAGVRRADAVITGAESARQEIVHAYGVAPSMIHVVPFGVDAGCFHPRLPDGGVPSGTSTVAGGRPYILFVNSLVPRKNVDVVRQAVGTLVADGYPHALVLVAKAPRHLQQDAADIEGRAFAPFAGHDDRVVHLEGLSDEALASVMAGATALCAPSRHEGFGLTVLEAMASGVPVVVSDRGSLPELVGAAGVVVEPTPDAVARALRELIDAPDAAHRLGLAARRRAETFSWDRTAQGWLEVARSVRKAAGRRR